jgi:hypothetical protein
MKSKLSTNQHEIHKEPGWHLQYSDEATGWLSKGCWFSLWWLEIGPLSKMPPLAVGPPHFLFSGYWELFSLGVKWVGHEADPQNRISMGRALVVLRHVGLTGPLCPLPRPES